MSSRTAVGRGAGLLALTLAVSVVSATTAPRAVAADDSGVPPRQQIVPGVVFEKAPPAPRPPKPEPRPAPRPERTARPAPPPLPTSIELTVAHANIYRGLGPSQFAADLRETATGEPDFVTLNEAVRPAALLALPGYSSYRGTASAWTLETPVLWRTDRWQAVGSGTRVLHARPGKWGVRAVNWVTVEHLVTGRRLSVVSAHASPTTSQTRGLLPVFMWNLSGLVRELSANGPVLMGGDLNVPYRSSQFPRPALAAAGLTPTYDVFGMPVGGTGDHAGATIDYVLFQPGAGLEPLGQSKAELLSDHDAVRASFRWSW